MKIAIIGFSFNHPTGRRNIAIFKELAKLKNINIDIITVSHFGDYNDKNLKDLETKNFRIHLLEPILFSKSSIQYRHHMKGLFHKIKEINPDIIYIVNEPLAINTFLTMIYAKILKKKIMSFSFENLYVKKFCLMYIYERFVIKNIDLFIAGTEDVKKILIRKGCKKDKIEVMPLTGIDTSFFKPGKEDICKKLKIEKNKTCLFTGRLEDEKGIKNILETKEILDKKGKKYYYVFVGDGSWYNKLKEISLKDSHVKILKWVDYNNLPKIYNSARVFLYPSIPHRLWEEQFGYSMVEAMACGVPVIASNVSGPRCIVKEKEDGILIPPADSESLAKKIEYLMEKNKEYSKFSAKAINNSKRFDNKILARKFYLILQKFNEKGYGTI